MSTLTRITVAEYLRMAEAGVWNRDRKIELLDGEIVDMAPMGTPHQAALIELLDWSSTNRPSGVRLSSQSPLVLPFARSVPEPDIVWLKPYPIHDRPPESRDAVLVIEIAESSVQQDLVAKRRLYAVAQIPEYWVVDLPRRRVVVHRGPGPEDYQSVTDYEETATLAPEAAPTAMIEIARLFGPRREAR